MCRETWETISLWFLPLRKSATPHPTPRRTFPLHPFHILIVSIWYTLSVSTGSDVMTWCNDALEHFLQKLYMSVQMLD